MVVRERITVGFVPTIHAEPMIAMAWPTDTPLRFLLTGGDTLQKAPPVPLPFEVVNNYGPTECTVVTTSGVVEVGVQGKPSIGRPITGASIYLWMNMASPCPMAILERFTSAAWALRVGIATLASPRGYASCPDPFSDASDARMYRSGDRRICGRTARLNFGDVLIVRRRSAGSVSVGQMAVFLFNTRASSLRQRSRIFRRLERTNL